MRQRDVFIYTDLRDLPQGNHYALTLYTTSGKILLHKLKKYNL